MYINNTGKSSKTRKMIGFLLSILMVFAILTNEIPSAYAENEPLPTETNQPTDEPESSEAPQPTEEPQSTETVQPTEEPQVSELLPDNTQSSGIDNAGDFINPETSGKPDKDLLGDAEKKLSTKILQLTNDEYLPSNVTRDELVSQMAEQNQIEQVNASSGVPGSSGTSVHVYIQAKKGSDLQALSKYAKIEDIDAKNGLATAWVDVSMIMSLASVGSVRSVREVIPPVVRTGSALSQGDSLLNADDLRATMGVDGTGIKVGIISDGVDHLATAVASGDLSSGSNAVHVLSNTVGGDEGTAILEIVHDLSPGAELYFHDCGNNTIAFNNAITELAQAGCDIIVDDIGWIAEPFFEDGSVAQHVADVMNTYGLVYVSSAGNAAKDHYQGLFVGWGNDDLFGDGCPTADFSGNGADPFLYVRVPAYSSMIIVMEWNDLFGNSSNDYDLEIYDTDSGDYLDGSYNWQEGSGDDPVEYIIYTNENSSAQDILIRASKYYDPETQILAADKILEIYTYGCYTYPTNTVAADSIFGHPAVPGVLSCGAIDGNSEDSTDYGLIEDFSSQGPVTMISGTREKPDICGIDGVTVTGVGGFPNPFYGTSAAAPHIAAIAALLESAFPTESSFNIRQMILDSSVDLGSSGYDNIYGYGRADAIAAVQRGSCKVTFDSRGGSEVSPQWVIKDGKINKPSNPSKTDWFFGGWYKEQECINAWDFANDTLTSDTTLYAKWNDSRYIYTVSENGTYDVSNCGDVSQVVIDPGLTVTLTNNSVTKLDIQIVCGEGVSLTINNLIIQCTNESALSFTGIGNSLILIGENSLKSALNKPGIKVEEGTSLEISGDGCVLSVSGSNAAGIGGGNGGNCGSITVNGGTICAWGIDSPYDIGSGAGGTGGALSILGDSGVLLANGTSVSPVTSTHELITTNVMQGDIVFGKIKLPNGWPRPIYAYLNSSAISTLTYDGNGGSGTVPEAVVQYNGTPTRLSKGIDLSKDGHSVASWNTQPDGLGTDFTTGEEYTLSADITLYAVYAVYPVTEYNAFDELGFTPLDTAMDPERDVVYMTESGGCRLYRVDLNTGEIGYIEFPYKAKALTVKNDKIYVTLPDKQSYMEDGSGYIGVVDAAIFSVDKIFSVVPDPYDIEADADGRVYIGSGSGQWSILSVYDTETGQRTDSVGSYRYKSLLDFNPEYNKLYSIDTDSSPRDITAYEITNGDITTYYDSPYHGDYDMSTYMKISPDGQYIFNGSGNVFTCAPNKTGDMVFAGNLGFTFNSICFDQRNNEFIIVNGDGMYICDYDTWAVKAAQGSKDSYKGVYCNGSHFVSLMGTSTGKYYIVLDNKTPGGLDVKGVTLSQDSVVMMDNETEMLSANISPEYATNQNMTWSSSNDSVATVLNGVITPTGTGSAVITVTTMQGGFKDTCNVTVLPYDEYSAYNGLWFTPLDTAIDPDRDFIYMTETGGYRLYRIDLNTGEIEYIKFPYKAERLTAKNGKIYVTLPHGRHDPYDFTDGSGSIAIIDAATFSVDKVFDVVPDPYDVEADDDGRVYIASGSGQWTSLAVYDTDAEQQISSTGIRQMSLLDFNAVYNKLYSIDTDSSPRDIKAYEITDGDITASYDSPYHGDYSMSTYMKVSPDGQYIFNGSGNVFACAPTKTGDMVYAGSLGLTFNSICFDQSNDEFIIGSDSGMYILDYDTWAVKAAQGSKDFYKGVYCNSSHFVSMMKTSAGKYYLVLDNKAPGLNVTGITMSPKTLIMMDDETENLTAAISPKYATNQNVTWTSSNESVATVSNGVITAVGKGNAVITATTEQGGFKDTCNVTVIAYQEYNAYEKLWFTPMDTAMDPDRAVVYMTETGGNKLYRVDLNTGKIVYIKFPYKAEMLTVKNDKVYVTLPHGNHDYYDFTDGSGSIAMVDASTFSVDKIFEVVPDPYDIEVDDEGRAYIGSGSGQWSILTVYDTQTGQQIESVDLFRQRSLLDFNPVYNKLYSITTDSIPTDITAYEITNGDITIYYDSPYHGDYDMSTYMEISPDGRYIFNGSGNVFTCAPTQTGDMVYAGTLGSAYTSVCFDLAGNRIYTCNENTLKAYAYDTKTIVGTITSPDQFVSLQYSGEKIIALQKNSSGVYYFKDYTIDCLLSDISLDGVSVSGFNPLIPDCSVTIPTNNDTINISAPALDASGQVSGDVGVQTLNLGVNTYTLTVTGTVTGQTKTYALHITRIVPGNTNLSAINTSAGSITPAFDKDTLSYTLSLDENTASTTITPMKEDSGATIKIDGSSVTSKAISVGTGSSVDVIIEVTAEDTITKKTYTIHAIRAVSTNASLSSLSTSAGTLTPAFKTGTYEYSVSLPSTTSSAKLSASKASNAATLRINGSIGTSITVSLSNGQSKDVFFHVTAQDGVTVKMYTVHVSRALSNNANLSSISLSSGALSPSFNVNTLQYNITLSSLTSGTTVSAVKADSTSTMKFDGTVASSKAVTLDPGQSQDVTIEVAAQDGVTVKSYIVHVTRVASNNANLSGISLSSGTLSPVFSANTIEYNVVLPCTVSEATITPAKIDSAAALKINRYVVPSITMTLVPGQTKDASIEVTAQDGITKKTYTVHVTRAPYSTNANLSAIKISSGTLSPTFNANTVEYSVTISSTTSWIDITPVITDSTATVKINGITITSTLQISLSPGQTRDASIEVTAQDSITKKTYTVHITRELYSTNANLSAINLSSGTLSPSFSANTVEYSVTLSSTVTGTTVTPVKADSTAAMKIDGVIESNKSVVLNKGETKDVIIELTAQDGVTIKTYTIHITRALYSSNANLSGISLSSGTLSPLFSVNTVEYSVTLSSAVTGTTVTPVKADSTATLRIDGNIVTNKTVSLTPGQTRDVVIEVTAQDGITKKTYTVHVTRAPYSSNANLSAINLSSGTLSTSFSVNTVEYSVTLSNTETGTTVTPVKADSTATLRIDGNIATSKTVSLTPGQTRDVIIDVSAQDGVTKKTYTLHITRERIRVTGVELNKTALELKVGDSSVISCTVVPADATDKNITWVSSNTDIATVSGGTVTAIAPGTAIITATADGMSDTCEVTVQPATYNIKAVSSNSVFGSVVGGNVYANNANVTLTAIPNAKCRFVRWKNGAAQVSTNAVYSFIANADLTLTAEFAPIGVPTVYAVSAGFNSAKITWAAVEGAAGYEVWCSTSANVTCTKLGTVSGTSFIDNGLSTNTTYYYKVNAYCKASTATTYGTQSVYATATPVPSAASVYAAPTSYNSAYVSWSAVPGASGYELSRATSQNGSYSVVKTTSSLSYTNTSLGTGTTYFYRVRAYRTVGRTKVWGEYSVIASAQPVLSSVTSASAKAYYPTSVKVSWSAVPGKSGYEIWRSTSPYSGFALLKSTGSTSYKDTTCTPFVTYYYQIRAYRTVNGHKVYSASASVTVNARPTLGNVTGVKVAVSSPSSIKLSWSSVSGCSGYEIRRSTAANGTYTAIKTTSSRSYTDSNLTPNTTYYYQVIAYRTAGGGKVYSTPCSPVSAMPVFGSVSNAKAVRSSVTKIKLTWSAVSGRTGYEIYRCTSPDGDFVFIKSTTSTSFTDSGLTTGVTYYYKIVAYRTVNGVKYRSKESMVYATP